MKILKIFLIAVTFSIMAFAVYVTKRDQAIFNPDFDTLEFIDHSEIKPF